MTRACTLKQRVTAANNEPLKRKTNRASERDDVLRFHRLIKYREELKNIVDINYVIETHPYM